MKKRRIGHLRYQKRTEEHYFWVKHNNEKLSLIYMKFNLREIDPGPGLISR